MSESAVFCRHCGFQVKDRSEVSPKVPGPDAAVPQSASDFGNGTPETAVSPADEKTAPPKKSKGCSLTFWLVMIDIGLLVWIIISYVSR